MINVTLTLAFLAGLVSFLSPCVLPLVPAYIGYMGGRVTHTVAVQTGSGAAVMTAPTIGRRFMTVLHSLAFIAGFTFIFVTIGLLGTAFVSVIGRQNVSLVTGLIGRAGGIVIIFFGLHFMGVIPSLLKRLLQRENLLKSPLIAVGVIAIASLLLMWVFEDWLPVLPIIALLAVWMGISGAFTDPAKFWVRFIERLQNALYADTRRQMAAQGRGGYFGSFLMGVVFSAGWTPCIGPIYGTILTMAAAGGDVGQAGSQLTAYSLGLGIPFLLAALLLDGAQVILRRLQRALHYIELVSGLFLVLIGILVASGRLQDLSQNFAARFSDFSVQLEDCAVDLYEGKIDIGGFFGCVGGSASPDATTETTTSSQESPSAASDSEVEVASITDLAGSIPSSDASSDSAISVAAVGSGIGDLAPNFTSVSETGETVSLAAYRGSVVLLNFWATWCGPCRVEMPEFQQAFSESASSGFVVIGVNNRETVEDVAGFRLEQSLTFPLVMDETGAIQDQYGVRSYPSTFVIDREGVIRAQHFGPLTSDEIDQLVGGALS